MTDASRHPDSAQVGDQIGGYRLIRLLGDGSTSAVFLGEHVKLGRQAAIKVLAAELTHDPQIIKRLLTEARVVNDIRHPNIIDISDFVEQDEPRRVALVMEYIEGPSLKAFRGAPLEYPRPLALCLQLVDAVQAAHARGVIHRDLKPDNLLLTFDPAMHPERPLELRVVDFGIAKIAGPTAQGMTVSGTMLGTPAYMAPEQIAGSPAPSPATDVFALGAVIYELATGERAYPSARLQETVRAKLRGEVPELAIPDVEGGRTLVQLVRRCLARQPDARPTLAEVRQVLDRLLRRAAGEQMTDALEIPTMGLTASLPLPGGATELSEIPPAAVEAMRRVASEDAATQLPQLMALLAHEDEDDEEDEVGTELARPSLAGMPALEHRPTEQASADPLGWGTVQRDIETAQRRTGVDAIPDQPSSPTNRILDALTEEIVPEPEPSTAPGGLHFGGLMSPAGVPEPSMSPNPETQLRFVDETEEVPDPTDPPKVELHQAPRIEAEAAPAPRPPPPAADPPPDLLFASAVGYQAPSPISVPSLNSDRRRAPKSVGWGLWLVLIALLVFIGVGIGVLTDVIPLPTDEAPAPTEPVTVQPTVTPR